jgi:hypothetical protein
MALTDLSSAQLERLVQLIKEKETLQARLEKVDQALKTLDEGSTPLDRKAGKARRRVSGRRRRVGLKDALLKALEAAGKAGITVKELAEKLGAKPSSVSVWFYTTGKKIKGIKKVGKAKYAFVAGS